MPISTQATFLSWFDLRIFEKRLFVIYTMVLLAALSLTTYYYNLNLVSPCLLIAAYCICLSVMMLLRKLNLVIKTEYYFLLITCAYLTCSILLEGVQSGQYIYYFPLLIGIPIITEFEQSNYKLLIFNSAVTFTSFLICILLGFYTTPVNPMPYLISEKVLMFNAILSMIMTAAFGFAFIYSHKLNFKVLIEQKNNTISSRTRFLSTMGHELRTPLNGVLGAVNLLKEEKY